MEQLLNDQASMLRQIASSRNATATYVSVSSGKGGVGKTTVVVNLACMLARMGKKVLVFDADLGLANIDIMLGISTTTNIGKYLQGDNSLESVIVKDIYGFDLLPASSGVVALTELSEGNYRKIQTLLTSINRSYDFIIFDTAAGIGQNVHSFVAMMDFVFIVSQPEPSAIADAYAFLKSAKQLYPIKEAYLIFNRVDDMIAADRVYQNLRQVVLKFLQINLKSIANIPDDLSMRRAIVGQKPIVISEPEAKSVESFKLLARRLVKLERGDT